MANIPSEIGSLFVFIGRGISGYPIFRHREYDLLFQYVPGGTYQMGFSEEEELAALKLTDRIQANVDEMRPVKTVRVAPMLVMSAPFLNIELDRIFPEIQSERKYLHYPAYLKKVLADKIAVKTGCRLPKEEEREYFARAGTTSLFVFGDALPTEEKLESWLSSDFSNLEALCPNAFGLYGIFCPEWCDDKYTLNYSESSPVMEDSFVIRGGGAYFRPWQDEEWVWCMSAMRYPSCDLIDEESCLRLVFDMPSSEEK
jgi:hypothetical protein